MAATYNRICSSPDAEAVDFTDMLLAAQKISRVFTSAGIKHGFLGGFAFRLLGSDRTTGDVDCCVNAGWGKVRKTLLTEPG